MTWIDGGDSGGGGKPEPSIHTFPNRRVGGEVAFGATQSVRGSINRAVNGGDAAVCKVVQFLLADLVNALVAGHPEVSGVVFDDGADGEVEQSLIDRVGCNVSVLDAVQS